ncbi:hypothetical protein VB738_11015 [Cyanobium gracile UHCC 0139]|uniref:Uncharacterized protein n=1 Tax=Cyanobium gracile UHCC 0139 TaxID=3110308 RepID=A0ABU5RVH1_9CYAN|nr:hypothetical protein [Cyanobium gracile]MEA5391786.1 hypothetical protein [Cyanobium gracile UHCC 0139]
MTTTPIPQVTREALLAFTQLLVECYSPEKVILPFVMPSTMGKSSIV